MRKTRRRGLDGRDQRVHDLVLDPVAEIARGDRPLESAPLVLDLLVLGEGVGDEREGAHVLAENGTQSLRRLPAHVAVLVREQVQRLGAAERLAPHGEAQRRHGLVEEPHPGRAAGDLLLEQEPLHLVGKLEGTKRPHIPHPGRVAGERRCLELVGERVVLDPVELEREEEQPAFRGGGLFANGLEELRRLGVVHRRAVDEVGVAREPLQGLLDRLVAGDQIGQGLAVEVADPACEFLVQCLCRRCGLLQVAPDLIRAGPGVEVGEVPSGKRPRIGLRGCGAPHERPRPRPNAGLRRSRKAASPSRWSAETLVRLS